MYKISDEVIKLINKKNMKNWRVELTTGEKCLTGGKALRGIFLGGLLLTFVTAILPLNHIFRKCYRRIQTS